MQTTFRRSRVHGVFCNRFYVLFVFLLPILFRSVDLVVVAVRLPFVVVVVVLCGGRNAECCRSCNGHMREIDRAVMTLKVPFVAKYCTGIRANRRRHRRCRCRCRWRFDASAGGQSLSRGVLSDLSDLWSWGLRGIGGGSL